MYSGMMAAMFAAFLMVTMSVGQPQPVERADAATARAVAGALGMYHTAAATWAGVNPSASGYVSSAALSLPSSWRDPGNLQAYFSGGYLVTWYSGPVTAARVVWAIDEATASEMGSGVTADGYVRSRRGTVLPLPSVVPAGVPARVTKIF